MSDARPILGIDPGITGGIAFLYPLGAKRTHVSESGDGGKTETCFRFEIQAFDIPVVGGEVDVDTLAALVEQHDPRLAIIERASAMPRQGVSSTFKYGVAYGSLRTLCTLGRIPYHLVTPGRWKNYVKLNADKEKSRALAIQFWPGAGCFSRKMDHGRAEAALIARYGVEVLERPT
jgi:hypothetical protein